MGTLIALVGAVLVSLLGMAAVLVGGMRLHWPPAIEAMRRLTMVLNKGQKDAGQPGKYGLLRHVGRTSGSVLETPLGIERTEDGFVIGMVYGERTQWVKNVLAAGSAEVVLEGQTYAVDRPEVVPIEAADAYISPGHQRTSSRFGVTQALRLYDAADESRATAPDQREGAASLE